MWNCLWQSGWSPALHFSQKYRVVFWHEEHLLFSPVYPVIDCAISNFITDFRQLSCRGEDICCCWFSKTSIIWINNTSPEIPVNSTCVLPQSTSADSTADMHCLLIDPNKNGKLATTISCYNDLSCKSWSFDRGNQLLPCLYHIEKYFEAGQSHPCHFELWHNDELSGGTFFSFAFHFFHKACKWF